MGIEIRNVSKRFGATVALDDVSLNLGDNKIYGLLGNNGAGKSTLLNLVTNRLYPSVGEVLLDGAPVQDSDEVLENMVLMGERDFYPEDTRVRRALKISAQLYPQFDLDYALELVRRFGLNPRAKLKELSTGYGTIARVIFALAANTPYLLLDEPVLGLDAQHRDMLYKEIIALYAQKPRTIVLSTHLIAEVANLVEHTIIIDRGQIVRNAPTEDLLARVRNVTGPKDAVAEAVADCEVMSQQVIGGMRIALVEMPEGCGLLDGAIARPDGIDVSPVNLQEYFIALMQMRERRVAATGAAMSNERVAR